MLRIATAGLLGSRERLWRREELSEIRTGPSRCAINEVPVTELQIHLRTGATFGFLVGRDEDELAFLVTALQRWLELPAKGDRLQEL
jgi:hypothetical protein